MNPFIRRLTIAFSILMTCTCLPLVSQADTKMVSDGDDSPSPIDISRAYSDHDNGKLVHGMTAHEPWAGGDLSHGYIWYQFSTDNDFRPERHLQIYWDEDAKKIRARIYGPGGGDGRFIGFVDVSRPSRKRVEVRIPKRMLRRGLRRYRWEVVAHYAKTDGPCSGESGGCWDEAPESGRVLHRL